ncbi:MAG: ribonuclease HII [Acidobacteria bacterium]|nr:ribonuclease HII [Acidobacteriota bacterium]
MENILSKPVRELSEYLHARKPGTAGKLLQALTEDPRKTARRLAVEIQKKRMRDIAEDERLENLMHFERELYRQGIRLIAGVDEAGVAPLAGPVVAAAVIPPQNYKLPGLDDSKKILNPGKRETLARQIKEDSVCWATGIAEVEEIDRLNVYRAGLLAMKRAVENLVEKPEYLLVDARTIPHCSIPQRAVVHGDALCGSIAAASIIAKTARDNCMMEMDRAYPGYGFANHKGYPTPEHLRLLKKKGPLPVHRKSYAPVRDALALAPAQKVLFPD